MSQSFRLDNVGLIRFDTLTKKLLMRALYDNQEILVSYLFGLG